MKIKLKPQEYYYLYSALRSESLEMIIYTLKSLCVNGDLDIFSRYILINKSDTKKRSRTFIKLNQIFLSPEKSSAELLLLSLFNKDEELRMYELKLRIEEKLNRDFKIFKDVYVYQDVKGKGFCTWKYFITSKGRVERKNCADLIDNAEKEAKLKTQDKDKLKQMLFELGSNVIFLDDEAQKKAAIYKSEFNDLELLFGVGQDNLPPTESEYIGGLYAGGGFSSGSGGGFSGFGGGDFGGGGAGGSW
ncbi:MAG: hypothetical protein ABI388_08690 [Bacteroidia bacterium]